MRCEVHESRQQGESAGQGTVPQHPFGEACLALQCCLPASGWACTRWTQMCVYLRLQDKPAGTLAHQFLVPSFHSGSVVPLTQGVVSAVSKTH